MIKKKYSQFTPHWFKYIDTHNQLNFTLFNNEPYVSFITHKPFNSSLKIAYFLDGIFYPTTTGAAYHIMNLLTALASSKIDTYLFRCYRGWEDPKIYNSFKFNTICIEPPTFYGDLDQVYELLNLYEINVVVFDTAEVILLQGSYFKNKLHIKLVQDVLNVDPLVSKSTGLKNAIIKQQESEVLKAEKIIDMYWAKTEYDAQALKQLGVNINKVNECGVGVDVTSFKVRKRNKLSTPIKAIYLGNMYYPPNIGGLEFLEQTCLSCIANKIPINIDIVGDGDFSALSTKYPHLNFKGKIESLIELLNNYDLAFSCPSYGSGISLKILDYLAAGIPTITNDVGIRGHNKEIEEAVLIDNSNNYYESIVKLLSSNKLYKELSTNSVAYVKKYFDIQNKYQNFINGLTKAKTNPKQ